MVLLRHWWDVSLAWQHYTVLNSLLALREIRAKRERLFIAAVMEVKTGSYLFSDGKHNYEQMSCSVAIKRNHVRCGLRGTKHGWDTLLQENQQILDLAISCNKSLDVSDVFLSLFQERSPCFRWSRSWCASSSSSSSLSPSSSTGQCSLRRQQYSFSTLTLHLSSWSLLVFLSVLLSPCNCPFLQCIDIQTHLVYSLVPHNSKKKKKKFSFLFYSRLHIVES